MDNQIKFNTNSQVGDNNANIQGNKNMINIWRYRAEGGIIGTVFGTLIVEIIIKLIFK